MVGWCCRLFTPRTTAVAAALVVEAAALRSSRSMPAAVAVAVAVIPAAHSLHSTPASAVVALEDAVHSYSTTVAAEIATASAACLLRLIVVVSVVVVAVVFVAAVVAVGVVVGVPSPTAAMLAWPYERAHGGRWSGAVKVRAGRGCVPMG